MPEGVDYLVCAYGLVGRWLTYLARGRFRHDPIVGLGSVAAPFLLMQPGMGAGVAASRTPRPATARLHSLVMHGVFGLGLYAAGLVTSLLDTF